jgi:hypothetical protein
MTTYAIAEVAFEELWLPPSAPSLEALPAPSAEWFDVLYGAASFSVRAAFAEDALIEAQKYTEVLDLDIGLPIASVTAVPHSPHEGVWYDNKASVSLEVYRTGVLETFDIKARELQQKKRQQLKLGADTSQGKLFQLVDKNDLTERSTIEDRYIYEYELVRQLLNLLVIR